MAAARDVVKSIREDVACHWSSSIAVRSNVHRHAVSPQIFGERLAVKTAIFQTFSNLVRALARSRKALS